MEYINEDLIKKVAVEMGIKPEQVKVVLDLLADGGTIPFIARYRKEVTGSLDEDQIREISKEYEYGVQLNKRKDDIKRLIDEKGMLTEELVAEIDAADKLITLEDIYRPFKEKKKTKATEAIKNGLEPLAKYILTFPINSYPVEEAKKYINEQVPTVEDALQGAKYIIAEQISDNKDYRTYIREGLLEHGFILSTKKPKAVDEMQTYKDYYDYKEMIKYQKSYRVLALNRAEDEKIITVSVEGNREYYVQYLKWQMVKKSQSSSNSAYLAFEACEDAYDRLIFPSIEREVRTILTEKAEDDAIKIFGDNLEHLLLSAPLKGKNVLGVDPSFRTGCKLAALDKTGKVLEIGVIYQNQKYPEEVVPQSRIEEAEKKIVSFVRKYSIDIISIGNGTASRETEKFIADTIKKNHLMCKYIITSEAGASVYSASKLAQEEFPDYQVEERSAASIGRRIQDPLAELIKIDPKAIGVGQYQHDVNQAKLGDTLDYVVEKAVNTIGVNVNTASRSLLQYVSGLNKGTAQSIVDYRSSNGEFKNRNEIKKVPKIGDKAFELCIGFLRIPESSNPLDKTSIHPESYKIAENILSILGFSKDDLGKEALINAINNSKIAEISEKVGASEVLVEDILKAFVAPMRDPRDELPQPVLKSDVLHLEDLKPGMELEGTVRNITDFGAFIDCGIKESGLVHISKMSKTRINHPSEVLKVGEIKKVYVLSVDIERKRLALSLINPNQE